MREVTRILPVAYWESKKAAFLTPFRRVYM